MRCDGDDGLTDGSVRFDTVPGRYDLTHLHAGIGLPTFAANPTISGDAETRVTVVLPAAQPTSTVEPTSTVVPASLPIDASDATPAAANRTERLTDRLGWTELGAAALAVISIVSMRPIRRRR